MSHSPAQVKSAGCSNPYDNSVLGKAHLLLGTFESGVISLRLSELCKRSGLNKATAYRLAQELVHWGFLERRGDKYQLGVRIFEMSQSVPITSALRQFARPILTDLFAATHATIHLSVLDGWHQVLCVEKVAGRGNILGPSDVGSRLPSTCTSSGKILLAAATKEHQIDLASVPLIRMTAKSVAAHSALSSQLATAGQRGFACEVGEVRLECSAVAVPVVDYSGRAFAALAATVRSEAAPEALVPVLKSASTTIGRMVDRWTMANGPFSLIERTPLTVA